MSDHTLKDDARQPSVEELEAGHPQRIDRYRVQSVLGKGGFGRVFLAHDDLLQRLVAIKVPHRWLVSRPQDVDAYLTEARNVANLDHANIVPVHDVGSTSEYPLFVVSKYIDGTDLKAKLKLAPLALHEAVMLVAAVADALHYSHKQGLVHRDVKPGNILLDRTGKPFVADFGLALREKDQGKGPRYAGTPPYMSPEQARGEGHRVDGRSDVFSLGVVFYELLTARRPFAGDSQELLEQITCVEARPPRQINDAIPIVLERICLKALSKRASDRYTSAKDMADDLRHALGELTAPAAAPVAGPRPIVEVSPPATDSIAAAVVPKGLRAFDADDADFFLDLLPGPRDRHGLPEAIRFWKNRIEHSDSEDCFPIGLLYGPSGCGKSSLVKAGLLPRLAIHVKTVYLEATADLEARLLHRLEKSCPEARGQAGLPAAMAAIRRRADAPPGEKVLIVLDQFEQWLHAHRQGSESQLVPALRQCDGSRLQCLVLVRDDFWMMATRFMRDMEVPVVEGHNAAAIDLFTPAHTRKVLAAFGRAYGTLPARGQELTPAQATFLDHAVAELTEDGWVTPVRLALFTEIVKRREWTGEALTALGGAVGIGVSFLDDSFTAATAPPEHRSHQKAVHAVLSALLPGPGTDIKGYMRSRTELLDASGYADKPAAFDALMTILNSKTRLLTPIAADHLEADAAPSPASRSAVAEQYYQLTHDYLVPSIREWLTRKQHETMRGRAEVRLAERGALWRAKPEPRQLPSFLEWLGIRLWTRPRTWTVSQQQMMRAAARYHLQNAVALAAGAVLLVGVVFLGRALWQGDRDARQAHALVQRLLDAKVAQTPTIIKELDRYRRWADPLLENVLADLKASPEHKLHALLALLPVGKHHVADLRDRLLKADPDQFPVIRDDLTPYRDDLVPHYWDVLASESQDRDQRFRAAAALATFDAPAPRWDEVKPWVAREMVAQPSLNLHRWVNALRPVKDQLIPELMAILRDRSTPSATSSVAAEIVAEYAADQPKVLAEALAYAGPDSFAILFSHLETHRGQVVPVLTAVLDETPAADGPSPNETAGRRANLTLAMLRSGAGERLWPLLKELANPRARSFVIDRSAPLGCNPNALLDRLDVEPDDSIRAALWLALGRFDTRALPADRREELRPRLLRTYHDDDSAAVHAAVFWLLGQWGMRPDVAPGGAEAAKDKKWYVNSHGHTMVRIAGPVTFQMGAPPEERGRTDNEKQHTASIEVPFDMAMTEVTVGQFRRFLTDVGGPGHQARLAELAPLPADIPVRRVTWYEAARYCNWLSQKEGIDPKQWCYEPNDKGKFANGMKLVANKPPGDGYRLPTETEWEYACRAGAATSRSYGDADDVLPRYAWFAANADDHAPVATLLPNAFGLFDMHGNAPEWCHGAYRGKYEDHPSPGLEEEVVKDDPYRSVRGASYSSYAKAIRSSKRYADRPTTIEGPGFRVARSRP